MGSIVFWIRQRGCLPNDQCAVMTTSPTALRSAPLLSSLAVACMLVVSMFSFAQLVQGLNHLQISSVIRLIGDRGRQVIRDMFHILDERPDSGIASAVAPRPKRSAIQARPVRLQDWMFVLLPDAPNRLRALL